MNYLILTVRDNSEFSYQALDYYRLLDGFLEPAVVDDVLNYINDPRSMPLDKIRSSVILAFRHLSFEEMRSIHDDNKIVYFINNDLHPSVAITGNAYDCFVAFSHRTAYKAANYLKTMNLQRPVYKIFPWVDTTGLKQYEKPPFGKVSGGQDMGLRPLLRLMASGAVPVVPDISPFSDVIINKWNGIVYRGEPDFAKISSEIGGVMRDIAIRAKELASTLLDKTAYIERLMDVLDGATLDHNEPWINTNYAKDHDWIIIKETIENGVVSRIPSANSNRLKTMKPLTLEQLLNLFATMRFGKAYVFDAIIEDVEVGKINRLLSILGDRAKNIIFCFDKPDKWGPALPRLTFMPASEAEKQVI